MQIDAKLGSRSAQIKLLEAIKELLSHFRFLISSCLLKWRTAFYEVSSSCSPGMKEQTEEGLCLYLIDLIDYLP